MPLAEGTPRPRRAVKHHQREPIHLELWRLRYRWLPSHVSTTVTIKKAGSRPLMMVARPRAVPIPRPRIALGPTRLNL